MKSYNTEQELLIVTGSSFAKKELCKSDILTNNKQSGIFRADKLEEACWNEMTSWLPGMMKRIRSKKFFLWKVIVANSFVCAELSKAPFLVNDLYSLNPYLFLSSKNYN